VPLIPNLLKLFEAAPEPVRNLGNPKIGYVPDAEKLKVFIAKNKKKNEYKEIPEQTRLKITLLNEAMTEEKPFVSEPEFLRIVTQACQSGTLKTKVSPWEMFRYFRVV
jgi:hypothetical protein